MIRWFVISVLAAAIAFVLGVILGVQARPERAFRPTREALASALFARYGNVVRGEASVRVPSGPKTGLRVRDPWWLDDAAYVLNYSRTYPRG